MVEDAGEGRAGDEELDELDAKVLEDLDVDEDADDVQGGAFTDGCLTRN